MFYTSLKDSTSLIFSLFPYFPVWNKQKKQQKTWLQAAPTRSCLPVGWQANEQKNCVDDFMLEETPERLSHMFESLSDPDSDESIELASFICLASDWC